MNIIKGKVLWASHHVCWCSVSSLFHCYLNFTLLYPGGKQPSNCGTDSIGCIISNNPSKITNVSNVHKLVVNQTYMIHYTRLLIITELYCFKNEIYLWLKNIFKQVKGMTNWVGCHVWITSSAMHKMHIK